MAFSAQHFQRRALGKKLASIKLSDWYRVATREYVGPPVVGLVSMAGCPLSLWVVVACGGAT
ncbi:MAG: hypothetical protein NXI28_26420, partial [bacterium]|nr:hypothetical protein [bacterium]